MNHEYFKSGDAWRLERSHGRESVIRVLESGRAVHRPPRFEAESIDRCDVLLPDATHDLLRIGREVDAAASPAEIERLTVITGRAVHRTGASGPVREWAEDSARLFVSLVDRNGGFRATLQLGSAHLESLDLAPLRELSHAFQAVDPRAVDPSPFIVLRPALSAALLRVLAGHPNPPGGMTIRQGTHRDLPFDGLGSPVEAFDPAGRPVAEWPNRFRPTYRLPPVPSLFHVLAGSRDGTPELHEPTEAPAGAHSVASGLLAPLELRGGRLEASLLCLRADGVASPRSIAMPTVEWLARMTCIGHDRTWFPLEAGAWGCELALDCG